MYSLVPCSHVDYCPRSSSLLILSDITSGLVWPGLERGMWGRSIRSRKGLGTRLIPVLPRHVPVRNTILYTCTQVQHKRAIRSAPLEWRQPFRLPRCTWTAGAVPVSKTLNRVSFCTGNARSFTDTYLMTFCCWRRGHVTRPPATHPYNSLHMPSQGSKSGDTN